MRKHTKVADLILLWGIALLAMTAALSFWARNQAPKMMTALEPAAERSEAVMEALCSAEYASAREMMYGQPELGVEEPPQSQAGALIWKAFQESMTYEFTGDCYASESGVSRDAAVTMLDIAAVTADMQQRVPTILEQRVSQAGSVEEIYDADNNYREAFVMDVLLEATRQAVERNQTMVTREITVQMTCQDDQWWVVLDKALLDVISGGYSDGRRVSQ